MHEQGKALTLQPPKVSPIAIPSVNVRSTLANDRQYSTSCPSCNIPPNAPPNLHVVTLQAVGKVFFGRAKTHSIHTTPIIHIFQRTPPYNPSGPKPGRARRNLPHPDPNQFGRLPAVLNHVVVYWTAGHAAPGIDAPRRVSSAFCIPQVGALYDDIIYGGEGVLEPIIRFVLRGLNKSVLERSVRLPPSQGPLPAGPSNCA